jgi:uncharacterized protein involved in copper resistance
MPNLVRKLLILAAVDGLVLQPSPLRNHAPTTQQAIKVDYKGNVGPLLQDRRDEDTAPTTVEAHGIVGATRPLAHHCPPQADAQAQASSKSQRPCSSSPSPAANTSPRSEASQCTKSRTSP